VEFRLFKRINFNNFSKGTASPFGRYFLALFAIFFAMFSVAQAQTEPPQFMTVDGRLYDSSSPTDPLLDASVLLKIQVLNPAKTCILYEEEQTVSTLSSNGYFNVRVGSPTSDPKRSTDDSNNSMMQVFQNQNASIAGRNSSGSGVPCSYTPANGDSRFFRFIVTPSSTGVTSQLSPDMTIDSVPQALVAESLQGLSPDSFIQVNANTTQAKADNIFGAGYAALTNLIGGTSSLYLQNTVNGTVIPNRATDPGSPTAGQIWYDSVANALKYYNGSTVQTLSTGVATDPSKLPLTGGAMTGNINMGGNQILGVGHITQNPQSTITLGTYTTAQQGTLTAALTAANKGATWFNSDTNKMMYWDGTVAQVVLDVSTAGTVGDITAVTAGTGLTGGGVTGAVTLNVDIGTGATQLITNSSIPNCPANQSIQMSPGPIYTMSCVATTDSSKLALAGGTMTGNITMSGNQILGAGHIVQANQSSITIGSYTTAQETPFVAALTAGNEGTLWFNSDTNELKYWDGAAAQVLTNIGSAGDMTAVNTNAGSGLSGGAASGAATLQIVVDNTGIEINGTNQLQLKDAGVVTAKLADNAVTTLKVANNAITSAKILDDEITNADINASAAIAWSKIDKTGANASDVNAVARAGDTMTGALNMDNEQELRLSEADINGANYVALKAPAIVGSNVTFTLPAVDGTNGQVLQTDGAGNLSFVAIASAPVSSVFGRTGAVVSANGDYTASQVTNVAAGGITGNTVQLAINELDTEKVAKAGDTMTGQLTMTNNITLNAQNQVRYADSDSSNYVAIQSPGTVTANYTLTLPDTAGTNGQVLSTNGSGVLSWVNASAGDITDVVAGAGLTGGAVSGSATLDIGAGTGIVVNANDIAVNVGTADGQIVQVQTGGKLPALDGSDLTNLDAGDISAGTLAVNRGGTGQSTYTDGQLLIGNSTGNTLTKATLTAGSGVTVTNGNGSITLASTLGTSVDLATEVTGTLPIGNGGTGATTANGALNALLPSQATNGGRVLSTDGTNASWVTPGASLSGLTAATGTNTIANANHAQVWNWDTLSTETAMSLGTSSGTTGTLMNLTNSYNNASSTGNVLKLNTTGASNAAVPLMITNAGTGSSLRVNDDGTDTDPSPFVIDASGNVGIGTTAPVASLHTTRNVRVGYNSTAGNGVDDSGIYVLSPNPIIGLRDTSSTNGWSIGASSAGTLGFKSQSETNLGTQVLTMLETGYVGIGTTVPAGPLDVSYLTPGQANHISLQVRHDDVADSFSLGVDSTTSGRKMTTSAQGGVWRQAMVFSDVNSTSHTFFGLASSNDSGATWQPRFVVRQDGNIGIGTAVPAAKLDVEGTIQIADGGELCAAPANAGMVRYSAGTIQYCNGSAWQTLGVSGAGLTTFNSQTGSTQTLATGATGLAPNWSSASDVHTLHIPLANGAGVTSGTISKTDYDAFNAKVAATRAVNTAAGSGLTGGGDLSVDRNLAVNITGTTAETVVAGTDEILIWDVSANALRKMTRTNFVLSESEVDAFVANNGYALATNYVAKAGDTMTGQLTMTNNITLNAQNQVRFADSDSSNFVAIQSPTTVGTNYTLTLPDTAGTNGQVLSTNGVGVLSWITPSTVPANNSLDFSHFVDSMTLDASTEITTGSHVLSITNDGVGNSFVVNDNGTADATPFVISNGGRVGVGVAGPVGVIHARGFTPSAPQLYLQDTQNGDGVGPRIRFANDDGDYLGEILGSRGPNSQSSRIHFFTRSGAVNAESMRIDTNRNVGIGTTVPAQKLDVQGTIMSGPKGVATGDGGAFLLEELVANGTNTVGFRAPDTIGSDVLWELPSADGTTGQVLQTNGAGILSWVTPSSTPANNSLDFSHFADNMSLDASTTITADNAEVLTITNIGTGNSFVVNDVASDTSPFVIDTNGNVGIGTSAPNSVLQLRTAGAPVLTLTNTTDDSAQIRMTNGGGWETMKMEVAADNQAYVRTGSILNFATGSTTRMTILGSGNVGIGTTAPGTLLDVAGSITSRPSGTGTGQTGQLIMRELLAGGTETVAIRAPDAITTSFALTLPNTAGTNGQILSTNGSGLLSWVNTPAPAANSLDFSHFVDNMTLDASTNIATMGTNVLSITNDGAGNSFIVNDNGLADTSPFVIDQNGNVGVGTASPAHKLHLWSGGNTNFSIEGPNGWNPTISFKEAGVERWSIYNLGTTDELSFWNGSATRMKLDQSGNLEIDSNIRFNDSDDSHYVGFVSPATVTNNTIWTLPDADGTSGQLLQTNGAGILSWVTPSSTPANNSLDFSHFVDSMALDASTNITADGAEVLSITNVGTANSFVVNDDTADASPFVIDASGNVGMGTTSPSYPLHINSNSNSAYARINNGSSNDGVGWYFGHGSGGSYGFVGIQGTANPAPYNTHDQMLVLSSDTDRIVFGSGTTERMRIQSGNVGIGTTAPGTLLDVAGAITSRPSGTGTGQTGQLIMRELLAGGTETVAIRAPDAIGTSFALTLPDTAGSSGQVLQTNGTGLLSWVTPSSTPANNSLDFSHFVDNMALDASTTITADNAEVLTITNIGTGNSFVVNDVASDTTPFVIDPSGNIGVGTTAPQFLVHAVTDIGSGNPAFISEAQGNTAGVGASFVGRRARDNAGALSAIQSGDTIAVFGGRGYHSSGWSSGSSASMQIYSEDNFTSVARGSGIRFQTTDVGTNTPSTKMTLAASGNLGIGPSSPSTTLDVAGAITSRPFGTGTGQTGQLIMRELVAGGTETVAIRAPDAIGTSFALTLPDTAGSSGQVLQTNGTGLLSWVTPSSTPANNSLDFSHFVNAMTLDASTEIATPGANVLSITNDGASDSFRVNDNGSGDTSPFVIDSTGRVGIGTATPTGTLHVAGGTAPTNTAGSPITITAQSAGTGANNAGGSVFITSGTGNGGGWPSGDIRLNTGAGTPGQIQFHAARNNNYSPTTASFIPSIISLHENSYFLTNSTALQGFSVRSGSTVQQYSYFGSLSIDGGGYTPAFVWGQQTSAGTSAERMRLDENGRFGIGTSAPGTLLDVAGAITSRPSGIGTGQTGQLIMRELLAGGTETVAIRAPDAIGTSFALTLPDTAGSSGQVLQTNGTGLLSWVNPSSAITDDSLNFDKFSDALVLDASTNISVGANILSVTNDGSGNSLVVNDNGVADSSPFVIDGSGNVGIGILSPIEAFHVDSNGDSTAAILVSGDASNNDKSVLVLRARNNSAVGGNGLGAGIAFFSETSNESYRNQAKILTEWTNVGSENADLVFETSLSGTLNERMRIDSAGNVGIGTATPGAKLDVVGDIQYTGVLTDVSDRRLKKDIRSLDSALDKILSTEGVSFVMKNDPEERTEIGVIAQDVEKVLPELVVTKNDEMQSKSVNYIGFIGYLIESIKEIYVQMMTNDKKHDLEIEKLKEQNQKLIELVEKQQQQIEKIQKDLDRQPASNTNKK
jgi:hypothetical protein